MSNAITSIIVLIYITIVISIANCYSCPDICICSYNFTSCQRRNLEELPPNLDPNITSLDLSHNDFEIFPIMSFEKLTHLNLSHNKLSTLERSIFNGMQDLEYLDLSYNYFKDWRDLGSLTFSQAQKLIYLDLSHNSLLGEPLFGPLQTLQILRMSNCSVQYVTNNLLEKLPNLRELHLSENPISDLDVSIKSQNLKFLDLSRCKLVRINSGAFFDLTSLETMLLHKNDNLKKFACNSPSLLYIDLSDCNLQSIPTGFLPNLYHANFHGNNFRTLANNSFTNLTNLKSLDLSYSALSIIEENAFYGLDKLESIDLSLNTLSTVLSPDVFSTNYQLKYLNLSRNYFSKLIPFSIKSLKGLDLSYNDIPNIDRDYLAGMPNLEVLNLSHTYISHIPDSFYAPNLVELDVSFCRIKSINNNTFDHMIPLKVLNLACNRLTTVCADCFLGVLYLDISDNPWRCGCKELRETYLWLEKKGKNADGLICQTPENVEGMSWLEACKNEWDPIMTAKKDTVWWYTTGLLLTVLFVLFILLAIRRVYMLKEKRLRREADQRRNDEREALRRMRRMQLEAQEESNQNAPDPRELQTPPSYNEALLLPKLDASHPSLAGSLASFGSKHSLHGSNPDVAKRHRPRRKRRRRKSDSSEGQQQRTSRPVVVDNSSDTSEHEQPQPRTTLESDF